MTATRLLRFIFHCLLAKSVGLAVRLVGLVAWSRVRRGVVGPRLCIESGAMGFELLEVKEVEQSAREFFGPDNVLRSTVEDRTRYLRTARKALRTGGITHYWVDPRSGHQSFFRAIGQSIGLALLLAHRGVSPIVWLTDVPVRRWRLQAEILSSATGVCFVLVEPQSCEIRLCGNRFIGPTVLPLSEATLDRLEAAKRHVSHASAPRAVFAGSLYEPRASSLERIRIQLAERGWVLDIIGRAAGGERRPEEEYWRNLLEADVIVTTAMQVAEDARSSDPALQPHLIYRYIEALACGTALVAPRVPGADHVLESGVHYLDFESEEQCVEIVSRLLENAALRAEVAQVGHARLRELLAGSAFWKAALSAASRRRARH